MMNRIDLVKIGGFAANEHLVTSHVPTPEPLENEVLVQVKASAINPVDWKMPEYGFMLPEKLPAALGCDVAGVIIKAKDPSLVGTRVVTYLGANKAQTTAHKGAFVQQVTVDTDLAAKIPDSVSFCEAATFPVGALTAEFLLKDLDLKEGSWVLVWGASSSVGYNCVQLALASGWKPIAVASGKHQAAMKDLGVTAFVDYRKDDVAAKVKDVVGTDKLNGAVDCIGDPASFGACCELVDSLGDSSSGPLAVSTTAPFLPDPPQSNIKKVPVDLGSALDDPESRKLIQEMLPEIVNFKPLPIRLVQGPFRAETVEKAFQINKDGVSGEKVVIEWTEE